MENRMSQHLESDSNEAHDEKLRLASLTDVRSAGIEYSRDVTSVVLYTADRHLKFANIQWLKPDLNLNVPPQNWMRARSPFERYVQMTLQLGQSRSHMSSFSMAIDHVDKVDDTDVISDAKNIRRLLSIPFSSDETVSLMVHRVGKTLLIDEFDIHKHLLRKLKDDWTWLKKFYEEQVKVGHVHKAQKTNQQIVEKNMYSKFLYYSIMAEEQKEAYVSQLVDQQESAEQQEQSGSEPFPNCTEDKGMEFFRTIEWNFKDLKMIIGTDLPIFSVGSSVVSLRLRDANSPITVLTGLEYWLDNLMCNVPEIAMCYHQSGFVQRYERFPTAKIPNLKDAEFKPEVVMDVAQNILSFLKSNATRFGHTYWLYKENKGDIIKLYDLTSLCKDEEDLKQDPFRLPLANLLLEVALKLYRKSNHNKSGMISALLTTSIALLKGEKPEVVVTANLILSELYLKEDSLISEFSTSTDEGNDDNNMDEDDEDDEMIGRFSECYGSGDCHTDETRFREVNVAALSQEHNRRSNKELCKFPPIAGDIESRCESALKYIAQGLTELDKDIEVMESNIKEEDDFVTCIPSVAIPLPYEPALGPSANLGKTTTSKATEASRHLIEKRHALLSLSWHRKSKASLLSKAMFACYNLAESSNLVMEFGTALKYVKLSVLCYCSLQNLDADLCNKRLELFALALRLCGDINLSLADRCNHNTYRKEYDALVDDESLILKSIYKDIMDDSHATLCFFCESTEENLKRSIQCYELCQSLYEQPSFESSVDNKTATIKRLGNSCNEIAKYYMDKALELYKTSTQEECDVAHNVQSLLLECSPYLDKALSYFRSVADHSNVALIMCNYAKWFRIKAQVLITSKHTQFTKEERAFYTQAIEKYQQAIAELPRGENVSSLKYMITFELSGVYCTVASLLQDYAPLSELSRDEIEREVTDLMLKALKFCDAVHNPDKHRQYKAATIHHRLASLYHNSYRDTPGLTEQKLRHLRTLIDSHYCKAAGLFSSLGSHVELLRVQLEQVALHEYDFKYASSSKNKLKYLEFSLGVLLSDDIMQCTKFLASSSNIAEHSEAIKLLNIFIGRLQFVTLNLAKVCSIQTGKKSRTESAEQKYKELYRLSLNIDASKSNITELAESVYSVLTEILKLNST